MVADYLVSNGYVKPDRIDIGGYGAEYPAVDNDTWTNRQKNRRVEIFILK
jgi:outer membrane protein OmpA-like peptidoglycan-associated protein